MNNLGEETAIRNPIKGDDDEIFIKTNFNYIDVKYHYDVPMAVFSIDEIGPKVIFDDFANISKMKTKDRDVGIILQNLAITYIVTLGMGHEYHEGVFDLPGGNFEDKRLLLISVRLKDPNASDQRLKRGYYQIALFVNKKEALNFPSCSYMEKDIIDIIKQFIPTADHLTPEILGFVKELIFDSISEKITRDRYKIQ